MTTQAVFHGTTEESHALVNAIAGNCGCAFGIMGVRLSTCVPHQALLDDQRWLDHLIYLRRLRDRLVQEEWTRELTS